MPMPQRLKVLISAYACEPNKGSEPEVGWQWALQMARFHDVTVLTRANNRPGIEQALAELRGQQPFPQFVYHDCGSIFLGLKRRFKLHKSYYVLWQKSAHDVVRRLHEANQFHLMHHVTFAAFRYPTALWGHGVPCIWGPVGGIESIPTRLLPWDHPPSLLHEVLRNVSNVVQAAPHLVLPRRARASALILASTREMERTFAKLGFESELMPTIGLKTAQLPFWPHRTREGSLRILYVGNIITLKGIDLALDALRLSQTDATFTLVGSGNYLASLQSQVQRLELGARVSFRGRLPREEVLKIYSDYDVFLFPSLHDTGGYAVIEAMANELPVICLDCGGPAVAVTAESGIKVPLGPRRKVIEDLAAAIRLYAQNRALVGSHGKAAREIVLNDYDWDKKGAKMHERYLTAR
jgi:glycosyltransferase involved in cell wall biosynthesis